MAQAGRKAKPDLSPDELAKIEAMLIYGRYRGGGLRSAANLVSALRGANDASTAKAKAKRTVSARWVQRQLEKCGKTASAAKLGIAKRRAKARRLDGITAYEGTRITRDGSGEKAAAPDSEK